MWLPLGSTQRNAHFGRTEKRTHGHLDITLEPGRRVAIPAPGLVEVRNTRRRRTFFALNGRHRPGCGPAGKRTPHNRNFWHFLALLRAVFSAMSPCSADPGAGSPGDGPADVSISQLFIFKCASTTPTTVGKPLYSPWIVRVWSPAARGTSVALLRGVPSPAPMSWSSAPGHALDGQEWTCGHRIGPDGGMVHSSYNAADSAPS